MRTSSDNSIPSHEHDQDAAISQHAAGLSQELAGRAIFASDNGVRRLIYRRTDLIEHNLMPDWKERYLAKPASWLAARLRRVVGSGNSARINADAERFAGNGLRYAAVSGSQPEVGLGGLVLGFGELITDAYARFSGRSRSDAIAQLYLNSRYQPRRIFGDMIDYHDAYQMLGWLGQISRVPKLWNLWAMQMVGRQRIRNKMDDQTIHGEIVRAATLGVRSDFYQFNRDLA
jgi:hypothetical protein